MASNIEYSKEKKVYDFSSAGMTGVESQNALPTKEDLAQNALPIGPVTPLELGYSLGGLLKMHTDIKEQIKDNFRNMIKTNWGDRLMHSDFGGNIGPLVFELGTENVDMEAVARIKRTTEKYMPYIQLITFETSSEKVDSTDAVIIKIIYSIDGLTDSDNIEEVIDILAEIA